MSLAAVKLDNKYVKAANKRNKLKPYFNKSVQLWGRYNKYLIVQRVSLIRACIFTLLISVKLIFSV